MKKLITLLLLLGSVCCFAQRQMENLGRGLVALKVTSGVYVNWRITGQEWYGAAYNLYRDGTKLNDTPITGASNYTDTGGTVQSTYTVSMVKNGVESSPSKKASVLTTNYLNIPLRELGIDGYEPNDVSVADLDGDGEMEILLKRLYPNWSPNAAHFSYIEAYKLDGTFMWAINVGPNIISDVENNVAAFDFDGDGKAEVFMRTSEGTTFADGTQIGDVNQDGITNYRSFSWAGESGDYPNHSTYLCNGPEFLSLIDGETGKELDRVDYIPRTFGGKTMEQIWGDGYGHRANKFFFGAPYLDGKKPSLFISRGIYTRIVMRTYDVVDKKLKFKWEFNTDENPAYAGQGNHNYNIADVDGDGCDEIVYGSMTVDNTGKGLYSTGLGHGDAIHVSDFDPYHKGLEVWACHENPPYGTSFRDAATGKILIRHSTAKDCGRCNAANVTNDFSGAELWGGGKMFSASSREATPGATSGGTENFAIYWDGDLLQETFDYPDLKQVQKNGYGEGAVFKYGKSSPLMLTSGAATNNYTKGTPCMQVDILGDWREEIIMRSADNKSLRIYMTTAPTEHRIYTLLHDMQYRQAICWQMCGYNQPPHVSYFLGEQEGITLPPPPAMTNDKLVYSGTGTWEGSSWTKNGSPTVYTDNTSLLFDADNGGIITLSKAVTPEILTVNSTGNYTMQGGALTGNMRLHKQGAGTLEIHSDLLYTGPTELWDGVTTLSADMQQSLVWMNRFAELNLKANAQKGIIQEYGSILHIGANHEKSTAIITDSLVMKRGAQLDMDIYDTDLSADLLKINGDLVLEEEAVLNIITHTSHEKILPGEYLLVEISGTIKGNISGMTIKGMDAISCSLIVRDHKIYLTILDTRAPTSLIWNGAYNNGEWNLASTKNFQNNGVEDVFVSFDHVTMNDDATQKAVTITFDVNPSALIVDAAANYSISGKKAIMGESSFTKKGSGTLTINNTNSFTGKVELLEGTVAVSSLANTTYATGSLGSLRTNAADFVINGATLKPNGNAITSSSPITVGENGATFNTTSEMNLEGQISGTGQVIKSGSFLLTVSYPGANTYTGGTVLNAGTLAMGKYNTTFGPKGSALTLAGGTLQILDIDNTSAVPDFNYAVTVPKGATSTLRAGSRCAINGSFSGEGTLNLFIPYVRADLFADWSKYSGKLNVTGRDFRLCAGLDMSGTSLVLGDGVSMGHFRAGSSSALSVTTKIGSLASTYATATIANGTYNVGYNNVNSNFAGVLNGITVNKYGTGTWTLTGKNTATLNIYEGKVLANTPSEVTTTGAVYVRSGGTLAGSGSVKNVTVYDGGTLEAAANTVLVGKFTVDGTLTLNKGKLFIKRRGSRNDNLTVTGNVNMTNAVIEIDASSALAEDNELKILNTSGTITGSFTLSPSTPGEGLKWDTSRFLSEGLLRVDKATGLHSIGADGPKIYPTAVTDMCYIDVSAACQGTVKMELYSADGKIVLTRAFDAAETQRIEMSEYPSGVYFLVLKAGDERIQQKITKL